MSPDPIRLGDIRLTAAGPDLQKTGLLGWVTCTINGCLRLDGITLRRTAAGRLTLSFPARKDRSGVIHPFLKPLDDATRVEIERQILGQLALEAERW